MMHQPGMTKNECEDYAATRRLTVCFDEIQAPMGPHLKCTFTDCHGGQYVLSEEATSWGRSWDNLRLACVIRLQEQRLKEANLA